MDEIFGSSTRGRAPSKRPLLTCSSRLAPSGVGILLATQKPGRPRLQRPGNAGQLLVHRTAADRAGQRTPPEGLEGVAAGHRRQSSTVQDDERSSPGWASACSSYYNVHEDAPQTFRTRFMDPCPTLAGRLPGRRSRLSPTPSAAEQPIKSAPPATAAAAPEAPPVPIGTTLPFRFPKGICPARWRRGGRGMPRTEMRSPRKSLSTTCLCEERRSRGPSLVYQAGVLAAATVSFVSDKSGVSTSARIRAWHRPRGSADSQLGEGRQLGHHSRGPGSQPAAGATFLPLPPAMQTAAPTAIGGAVSPIGLFGPSWWRSSEAQPTS